MATETLEEKLDRLIKEGAAIKFEPLIYGTKAVVTTANGWTHVGFSTAGVVEALTLTRQ